MGFFKFCEENGIACEKTAVGDRYVLERMLQKGYNIGGEQSGHVISWITPPPVTVSLAVCSCLRQW